MHTIAKIEARAKEAGVVMVEALADARVNPSTWWRWRQGTDPSSSRLRRVAEAVEARAKKVTS